jgi:hypothetical protein
MGLDSLIPHFIVQNKVELRWAGVLVGGIGLIAIIVLSAIRQSENDLAHSDNLVLGTPLQDALSTQVINALSELSADPVTHVDVVYFHRTQRCKSCLNAGRFTRETIETIYADLLKRGTLSFRELNIEKTENAAVVGKYDALGSALYIGVVVGRTEYLYQIKEILFYTDHHSQFVNTLQQTLGGLVRGL